MFDVYNTDWMEDLLVLEKQRRDGLINKHQHFNEVSEILKRYSANEPERQEVHDVIADVRKNYSQLLTTNVAYFQNTDNKHFCLEVLLAKENKPATPYNVFMVKTAIQLENESAANEHSDKADAYAEKQMENRIKQIILFY